MATAAVSPQVKITKLPPGPERPELRFQPHITYAKILPVSARFGGHDEWETPGLSFIDYGRMQTFERNKPGNYRRLDTPLWATDNRLLRSVICAHMEARAQMRSPGRGSEQTRMARAEAQIKKQSKQREGTINHLCQQYVALKRAGTDEKKLRSLAAQIENIDTTLRIDRNIPQFLCGVVYHYFRVGQDSVATALALGLKPPHVRQTIWRLKKQAKLLQDFQSTRVGPKIRINLLGHNYRPAIKRRRHAPLPRKSKLGRSFWRSLDYELAAQLFAAGKSTREVCKACRVPLNRRSRFRTILQVRGLLAKGNRGRPLTGR